MSMRTDLPKETTTSLHTASTTTFALSFPDVSHSVEGSASATEGGVLKWEDLSATEKSAASLGVHPDSWKPIAFMNTANNDTLLKTNTIDSDLAKQLEAYKHVSLGGS
jgi:hypothetical protein